MWDGSPHKCMWLRFNPRFQQWMDALLINRENQDVKPYFRDVCRNYKGRIPLGRLVPTQTIRSHMDWILIRIKMVPVAGPRPAGIRVGDSNRSRRSINGRVVAVVMKS